MRINEKEIYYWVFVLSVGVAIFTHYLTIFFIAGEVLYSWLFIRKKGSFGDMVIWIVPILLIARAGMFFLQQMSRIHGYWFEASSWESMLSTFFYAFFNFNARSVPLLNTILGYAFLIVMFVVIFYYLGMVKGEERKFSCFLLLWYLCAVLGGMALNIFITHVYHHRFFFFEAWILILLFARAVSFLFCRESKKIRISALMVLIFVGIMYFTSSVYFANQDHQLSDMANIIRVGETNVVVHDSSFSMVPMMYYLGDHIFINILYVNASDRVNSASGDVISNRVDDIDKFNLNSFYFVTEGKGSLDGYNMTNLYNGTGVGLFLVHRSQ
jgi:hypothetical protein